MLRLLCFAIALTIVTQAEARGSKPLSAADQQALQQTQQMLNDRAKVQEYTSQNPEAKGADEAVQALLGANSPAAYALASEILGDLVNQANGDPLKLSQLVEKAKRDPGAFISRMTPAQRAKFDALVKSAEQGQTNPSKP